MNIQSLSELQKLIKIMRKTGVESLKSGDLDIKLRPEAPRTKRELKMAIKDDGFIPGNKYSEEDLLFWSSTPPGIANG